MAAFAVVPAAGAGAALAVLGLSLACPAALAETGGPDRVGASEAPASAAASPGRDAVRVAHRSESRGRSSPHPSAVTAAAAGRYGSSAVRSAARSARPAATALPGRKSGLPVPASARAVARPEASQRVTTAAASASPADSISAAVNTLFNSAFDWLGSFPANPLTGALEGALVLVRRGLFFIPTGVSATQTGTVLSIAVSTGSVAYLRRDGTVLQVSDVPLYCGAAEFTASTVSDVSVTNPGNAGRAGLNVSAGSVAADLTATGVDAITFGDTAEFTGAVRATVSASTLTLTNAVRGLSGVSLSGPVRLRTDVEVDAGTGDATFTGTVDATTSGAQALTVTALGTTTFGAAVGGQAALGGLATRGIAPLTLAQSADSRTIPLHYLPTYYDVFAPTNSQLVKYGIDVAIGDNPSRMYLFDTGAPGFFAGYDSAAWRNVPLGTQSVFIDYGDGTEFDSVATNAVVTLGTGSHTVSTGQPVQIAAIITGSGPDPSNSFLDFTNPDVPPWLSHYFGDFGADLQVFAVDGQPTLASPLFQLPGNLSSGFLVQLGPIGVQPQLTVGVTDALRNQFPYAIPFTAAGPLFPVSGYPSADQFAFTGQYSVSQPGGPTVVLGTYDFPGCAQQCLPTLIDSGAPSASVNLAGTSPPFPYAVDGNNESPLQPGTTVTATFPTAAGRPALTWSFVAGDNQSVDYLVYYAYPDTQASSQTMGPGLTLYNDFDVMFDVRDQVIWLRPTSAQAGVVLQSVTTTGAQSYAQKAELDGTYRTGGADFTVGGVTTLIGNTVIDTGAGDVTFSGSVDGGVALTVNSAGSTTFTRGTGSLSPLTTITTDRVGRTVTNGVETLGNQEYRDDLILSGNYFAGGRFAVGGSTILSGPVKLTANDGVELGGPVDSLAYKGFPLYLTASGPIMFGDAVGATNPLGGLTLSDGSAGSQPVTATATAPINLNGALGYSTNSTSLPLGMLINGVTAVFTGGGVIQQFDSAGIFVEDSANSRLEGFTIIGNGSADSTGGISASGQITNLQVVDCAIRVNTGAGVTVDGPASLGNAILSNSIYNNTGAGIVLSDGANGGQGAPQNLVAQQLTAQTAVVSGTVPAAGGYTGEFLVQIFGNGSGLPGQYLIGQTVTSGAFSVAVPTSAGLPDFPFLAYSATATPVTGARNTSPFSEAVPLTLS
ncbi:MAG: beta strand repeat-containing protein [Mycobacterium sp.]